ncbi:MAG: nucleoside-diphosphate sugar epimerase/dehydratase [Chloroflexota bacterium]|nr:nucleoside-diphosphate sugar epimerase/dehydratase [Chloroflexota bacterium]
MKKRSLLRWVRGKVLQVRNRYLMLTDILTLSLVIYSAFLLRLEHFPRGQYAQTAFYFTLSSVLIKIFTFFILGGYSRYWLFTGMSELMLILKGTVLGVSLSAAAIWVGAAWLDFPPPPRSIPLIDLCLTCAALAVPRLGLRWFNTLWTAEQGTVPLQRALIVGAGEAGWWVLREIRKNYELGLRVVGFVDDDPAKQRLNVNGVRILGVIDTLPQIVKEQRVEQVLVAIPSATAAEMRQIVEICHESQVEVLTLPGMYEMIAGDVQIQRFRPVQVEDLLARELIETDTTQVMLLLKGKEVLVTGAGGSIGTELCRQVARCQPAEILLLGHGENSIFNILHELRATFPDLAVEPLIADIRDEERIQQLFESYRPEVVFHAAAHKHVPLMEANPIEAVTNNVGGTWNVLRAAEQSGCSRLVMISTDKAVNPTSIMGATKRVAEHLLQDAAQRTGRCFVAVRFGNVLGSRGSVVPFFERQIKAGGPVTVTHPEVKRYFMTIPEAVQLVLQAAALGEGGEVFVLDMGEPLKIVDLAQDMIRLSGREGIEIKFVGLRPGEKLFEELFLDEESYQRTRHEKIFVSRNGHGPEQSLARQVARLLALAQQGDEAGIYWAVKEIVPECYPSFLARE